MTASSSDTVEIEDAFLVRLQTIFASLIADSSPGGVYVGHQPHRNDQAPWEAQVAHNDDGYIRQDMSISVYSFDILLRSHGAELTEERVEANRLRTVHFSFREWYHGRPENLSDESLLNIDSITVGSLSKIEVFGANIYDKGDGTAIRRSTSFTVTVKVFS